MPAFMKLGDVKGEATDKGHKNWVILQSMSAAIARTIPEGAKDQQRARGDTILADVAVVRDLDRSSTKLQEACANGTFFKEVEIHLCTTVKNRQEPYLKYVLSDVILTSYSISASSSGEPLPCESVTLGYSNASWTYIKVDPKSGDPTGHVPAGYNPGEGRAAA